MPITLVQHPELVLVAIRLGNGFREDFQGEIIAFIQKDQLANATEPLTENTPESNRKRREFVHLNLYDQGMTVPDIPEHIFPEPTAIISFRRINLIGFQVLS